MSKLSCPPLLVLRTASQPTMEGGSGICRHTVSPVPPRSKLAEPVKGGNTATNKHTSCGLASYCGILKVGRPRG